MTTTATLDSPTETQLQSPPCPHFGPCGGCQLQNLSYQAQLEQKRDRLSGLLRAANLTFPQIQLHASPPLGYRNRVRFTLAQYGNELRAGYISVARAGDGTPLDGLDPLAEAVETVPDVPPVVAQSAFLPITQCPISAGILWKTTESFVAEVNARSITWLERAPFALDQIELFTSADESQVQISLYVRTAAKGLPDRYENELTALCEAIRASIPALTGAGMYLLPAKARSRRIEQPRPGPAWGSRGINYIVTRPGETDGTAYWVPRGAFFQINRFLITELVDVVVDGRSGALAWDLYAGVGLFTKALAPRFQRITSVEVADPAFTALASAKIPNRHAVKSTTVEYLDHALVQRDRPELVILDPPRTGAGAEVCELLGRLAPAEMVYVSCSPHTLPEDLTTLTAAGYSISQLHLLDLFPQTSHIETVAVLSRTK